MEQLVSRWDAIALTEKAELVVQALQIINPAIGGITFTSSLSYKRHEEGDRLDRLAPIAYFTLPGLLHLIFATNYNFSWLNFMYNNREGDMPAEIVVV